MQVKDAEIESLLEERERLDAALQSIKGQIQLAASPQSRQQEPGAGRASLHVPTLRHVWLLLGIQTGPWGPRLPSGAQRSTVESSDAYCIARSTRRPARHTAAPSAALLSVRLISPHPMHPMTLSS